MLKNLPANAGDRRDGGLVPGSGRFPWRRAWQPTAVFLPGESHEKKRLAGYSPWGHKESDTTKMMEHTHGQLSSNNLPGLHTSDWSSIWNDSPAFLPLRFLGGNSVPDSQRCSRFNNLLGIQSPITWPFLFLEFSVYPPFQTEALVFKVGYCRVWEG